jgi:uncharacterized protein (DUF362 family)/NAD-dependent dihydropyrimidine dehydrogenase PreA subunit
MWMDDGGRIEANSMENKVYVVRCPDYDQVRVRMAELFDLMGGMGRFIAPGERIALKANLLRPVEPDKAATTHPAVVAAVGELAKQEGAIPVVVDSPGSGYEYKKRTLERVYRVCGMQNAAEEAGFDVNFDTRYRAVSFPDGELAKHFEMIAPVIEADGVFNLCKLKTHVYMGMTGAIKNSFGVIPGRAKPGYHAKLCDKGRFARMLLDLSACVSPRLSVMDAVVGMEGDGPNAGEPRHIGLLLAATNPLAMDVVAGEIVGLDREYNCVLVEAEKRGLYPTRSEQVGVIGADVNELRVPGFELPSTLASGAGWGDTMAWWQRALTPLFRDGLSLKPGVVEDRCVACGACRDACPVTAISQADGRPPWIDEGECIRCYCCHEMCPERAIELRPSPLYRLINW